MRIAVVEGAAQRAEGDGGVHQVTAAAVKRPLGPVGMSTGGGERRT